MHPVWLPSATANVAEVWRFHGLILLLWTDGALTIGDDE
jgi:hypothetical protein